MKVLIKFPHGMGDSVQASVMLKHLRKYRPEWVVDFVCGKGKDSIARGLCNRVWHDKEPQPDPKDYDREIFLGWWEDYNGYTDRPNSKITNCLQEVFGIDYDPELGRYDINVPGHVAATASQYLREIGCHPSKGKYNAVLLHVSGNTSPERKNIAHWQAEPICRSLIKAGFVPVILDWDKRCKFVDNKTIFTPYVGPGDIWGGFGSGDAATIAALISMSSAFVGIDSGPGKCASATETPSLICWTEHHPMQFHDPAPNTTHLVPAKHREMEPCRRHDGIWKYFENHYNFRTYACPYKLIDGILTWLCEVLGVPLEFPVPTFVTPNGIGDVVWALHKIKSIANGQPIKLVLSGDPGNYVDQRSVPFVKRFPFVSEVSVQDIPVLASLDNVSDEKGRYRYKPDGMIGHHHFLCPNGALEKGIELKDWLPEYPVDWGIIDEFDWSGTEAGTIAGQDLGQFVCFYLGPEAGNVEEGHARGFQFEPSQWRELGKLISMRGYKIVVIGAEYDRSYWQKYVKDGVISDGQQWRDYIGRFEIGECFAFIKQAKFLISYQCGLAIVSHYMGGKVCCWWRKDGDSIHPGRYISFDNRMARAWLNPKYADNFIDLQYKRESVQDIFGEIVKRGWV